MQVLALYRAMYTWNVLLIIFVVSYIFGLFAAWPAFQWKNVVEIIKICIFYIYVDYTRVFFFIEILPYVRRTYVCTFHK